MILLALLHLGVLVCGWKLSSCNEPRLLFSNGTRARGGLALVTRGVGVFEYDRLNSREVCSVLANSQKYDDRCHNSQEKPGVFPLLITSVPGSGSRPIVNIFQKCGYDALHDDEAPDITVSWEHAVSNQVIDAPYPWLPRNINALQRPRFEVVVHLVRSPMSTIGALLTHSARTKNFIHRAGIPPLAVQKDMLPTSSITDSAFSNNSMIYTAEVWYAWNLHIESYADLRFRVEDLSCFDEDSCARANGILADVLSRVPRFAPPTSKNDKARTIGTTQIKASCAMNLESNDQQSSKRSLRAVASLSSSRKIPSYKNITFGYLAHAYIESFTYTRGHHRHRRTSEACGGVEKGKEIALFFLENFLAMAHRYGYLLQTKSTIFV